MAAGMGLGPEAFWRLSLAEWRILTEVPPGVAPLGRSEFEQMMAMWPDDPPPLGEVARRAST